MSDRRLIKLIESDGYFETPKEWNHACLCCETTKFKPKHAETVKQMCKCEIVCRV